MVAEELVPTDVEFKTRSLGKSPESTGIGRRGI